MVVYLITNKANGKIYVGKTTKTIQQRWKDHCRGAARGCQFYLSKAIRKYGQNSFSVKRLATARSEEELNRLERKYIARLHSNLSQFGYNMTLGGDGISGLVHKESTKRKISAAHIGIGHSNETKEKLRQIGLTRGISEEQRARMLAGMTEEGRERSRKARLGKKHTPEARAKIGRKSLGHSLSEEARGKLRAAHTGKKLSEETREKLRNANLGKRHSTSTKRKMSITRRGKKRPPEVGQKVRNWIQRLTPAQRLERMRPCLEARAKRRMARVI